MDNTKFIIDTLKIERALTGLAEWQKHVQKGSDIDRDISVVVEVLKAQLDTDAPDTNVGVTISRQAAIDVINEIIHMEHSLRQKVYVAKDAIKKLPSAEPEIIYCKDCKHFIREDREEYMPYGFYNTYFHTFCDKHWDREQGEYIDVNLDDFCSFAERRTDELGDS